MCPKRDNDPNDPSKGRTKVSDCGQCSCPDSDIPHSYYGGKCMKCGAKQ
jgi:hypothetical protein